MKPDSGLSELVRRRAQQEWRAVQDRIGDFERREWPRFSTYVRLVSSNTTLTNDDGTILVDTSGGPLTMTLPTAVGQPGRRFTIKDYTGDAGDNPITIDPAGAETVDGLSTLVLNREFAAVTVQSDGAGWVVVDDAHGGASIVLARHFATLADAIAAAQAAGARLVQLEPGTAYTVSATITLNTDDLELVGAPGATISFAGTSPLFSVSAGTDGLVFRDLVISAPSAIANFVAWTDGTRGRFINCRFANGGVQIGDNPPSTIHTDLYVSRCSFFGAAGNGLTLVGVRNALIEDCYFEDNGSDGIKMNVAPCENVIILACRFIDNDDDAIDFYGGGEMGNKIIGCYFHTGNVEIKAAGGSPSGVRPDLSGCIVRDSVFGNNARIVVFSKFIPFDQTRDVIVGDGVTTVFNVAHHLSFTGTAAVKVRVFNGATELVNPTHFTYTTPAINTVQITFAAAVPNLAQRQVIIMGGTVFAVDQFETTLTAGSSSYVVNHNLNTKRLEVRAYNKPDQTTTAISSITYTSRNQITVNFSGNLANDHRLLIWRRHDGTQGVLIEGNTFYNEPGDVRGVGPVIDGRGSSQFIIRGNHFREIQDQTCIEMQTPHGLGIISDNFFERCEFGFQIRVTGDTAPNANDFGLPDRQGTIVVRNNVAYKSGGRLLSMTLEPRNHRVISGNRAIEPTGTATAAAQFQDVMDPQPGYRRAVRDNMVVATDGTIDDILQSENNTFADGDTTPDVSSGDVWQTANTGATTISDLDGEVADGETKYIYVGDNNTAFDFTGTALKRDGGTDWTPATGDWLKATYFNGNWYCVTMEV